LKFQGYLIEEDKMIKKCVVSLLYPLCTDQAYAVGSKLLASRFLARKSSTGSSRASFSPRQRNKST